jgi:hypothetical protein
MLNPAPHHPFPYRPETNCEPRGQRQPRPVEDLDRPHPGDRRERRRRGDVGHVLRMISGVERMHRRQTARPGNSMLGEGVRVDPPWPPGTSHPGR